MSVQGRISTRLTHVGALVEETYAIFQGWDRALDFEANLARVRAENPLGARSASWMDVVIKTVSSRFRTTGDFMPLVVLAQGGMPLELWRPCLLWHAGRIDALFHAFLLGWLFRSHEDGVYRIRTPDVVPFVVEQTAGKLTGGKSLNERNAVSTTQDLLALTTEFGLLKGRSVREFVSYHLPDESFLYVLHALAEQEPSPRRILDSPEWRMFLLTPEDVEREVLRLHQFQRLDYQAAGSLVQLKLPYPTLRAYAESVVA